jgi:hypothetical protein
MSIESNYLTQRQAKSGCWSEATRFQWRARCEELNSLN